MRVLPAAKAKQSPGEKGATRLRHLQQRVTDARGVAELPGHAQPTIDSLREKRPKKNPFLADPRHSPHS